MLKLSIERAGAIVPRPASTLNSRSEIWRDNEGAVCAYGEILGEEYWMHLPGVASFRFSSRGDEISAAVASDAKEEFILDAYRRSVLPMAFQVCGREVLHASAVRTGAGVVAFCGISETGKSTIAFGLSRRGYTLWADDAVAFEISDGGSLAISLPFDIRLHPSARELFDLRPSPPPTGADDDYPPPGLESAPLMAVCVLRRVDDAAAPPVAARRLSPPEAFGAVLAHAYCFTLQDGERKRRMMHQYLDLVAGIPIFDICFQSDLANLPKVLDLIEQVVEESAQKV